MMKIVNQTVPEDIRKLGYDSEQIEHIISQSKRMIPLKAHYLFEGRPCSVFDSAFKPAKGERYVRYMGHIEMMSAVKPFLSGAIFQKENRSICR